MIVSIIRRCQTLNGSQPSHGLILQKDRGSLNKPSDSTVQIYLESEKRIQKMLLVISQQPPGGPGIPDALSYAILKEFSRHLKITWRTWNPTIIMPIHWLRLSIKRLHQNTHAPPDKTTQRTDHWKGRSQRNSQAQSFQTSVNNCTVVREKG